MPLSVGDKLGPYEIFAPIGAGGMGEVYCAGDATLDRKRRERNMEHEHTHEAIRQRLAAGPANSYLRDWVYGGIDGTVTTA